MTTPLAIPDAPRQEAGRAVTHVVALSGGKDSTSLALHLRELQPETPFQFFCTPTGDELPEMVAHWERLEALLGMPLIRVTNGTLADCIQRNGALPSFRMRFCTRELKIQPCLAFLRAHQPAVLYVGLRADEEERRGIYSADVTCRFPLREWGWGLAEVRRYLRERGVRIPARTDCARCPYQRLGEWRELLRRYPDRWADAEAMEAQYAATFRSPSRDSQPTALRDLRILWESQPGLPFDSEEEDDAEGACRVCRL